MAAIMFDILERGLNTGVPARRTPHQNHATLLVSWWCTGFAFVIILLRVCGRFVRTERLFREDKIMFWSIVPLFIRMGLVHVVMLYGTNNALVEGLPAIALQHRAIGSRLVLASRIFYALFIWTAKWTVSEFLKRLATATWNDTYDRTLRGIRIFLILTFIAVVISTLGECHPFDHYWQVSPDPGPTCRNGYAQLLTMGISDSLTDVALIIFPIPIILKSQMPAQRKISLVLLFALSAILIAITVVRMVDIIDLYGRQQRRTLWASIEILAAASVSNALILGSFVRDRGVKKVRYKDSAAARINSDQPSYNRTMTLAHWGSDSDVDLFRSLGCRMNSMSGLGFDEESNREPPLKMTDMTHLAPNGDPDAINGRYQPSRTFQSLSDFLLADPAPQTVAGHQEARGRSASFYHYGSNANDPGDNPSPTDLHRMSFLTPIPSTGESGTTLDPVTQAEGRAGGVAANVSLSDAGGLLSPMPNANRARSRSPNMLARAIRSRSRGSPSRDRRASRSRSRAPRSMDRGPRASVPAGPDDMQLGDAGGLLS